MINDEILRIIIGVSEEIRRELTSILELVKVLNKIYACLKDILNYQKGYVVEFSVDSKKYHPLNDCFFGDWSDNSKKIFYNFFRQHNEWRDVERGCLYKKLLNREDPLIPQLIENWLESKNEDQDYWIDDRLRIKETEIRSAIVTPFVGWKGRHYLTMIAFTEIPNRKQIEIHNLILSSVVSELVSRGSKTFPIYSIENIVREKAKDLMDVRIVGFDNLHHAQRVKKICERLAEYLTLNDDELFQIKTAALLHDYGKTGSERDTINIDKKEFSIFLGKSDLSPDIRMKVADNFNGVQKQSEIIFRQHAEIGTTMLFGLFENIRDAKFLEWLFIVLAHHHYIDYYKDNSLTNGILKRFLAEQGMPATENRHVYMKNIIDYLKKEKNKILKLIDVLVLADYFDDKCGWKFHRTEQRQRPEGAMIDVCNVRDTILMTEEVKKIIEIAKQSIYDIYDEPKLI